MPIISSKQTAEHIESQLDDLWRLINQQQATKAQQACSAFVEEYPENSDGWYAYSFLLFQLKNFELALSYINKSIAIEPKNSQWRIHKAHTLLRHQAFQQCSIECEALLSYSIRELNACLELANICNELQRYTQARTLYLQALTLVDNQAQKAQLTFNLATVERYLGNFEQAEQWLNQTLTLNPYDSEAMLVRSNIKKQSIEANHITDIAQCLKNIKLHPQQQSQLHYALAKEYEDIGEFAQSFAALSRGAHLRRAQMNYKVQDDIATIYSIIKTFDQNCISTIQNSQKQTNNNGEQAIFILGLPRTGSTLIERVLGAHSRIHSVGELNNFALELINLTQSSFNASPRNKQQLVELTKRLNFNELGQNYLKSIAHLVPDSMHFIDKMPINSLYAGLIHLAMPKAKILHIKRNPLDSCYAIFKQSFTQGYPFSYDLKDLAEYFIAHHKLMAHWQKVMPDAICHINYEDVVASLHSEARRVIDFCQLPWQDACVNFHLNNAPSTTASASQVREKIYRGSVNKWRHYQAQLAELKARLEQAGISCD